LADTDLLADLPASACQVLTMPYEAQ